MKTPVKGTPWGSYTTVENSHSYEDLRTCVQGGNNLGVACGPSGLVVIDVDCDKVTGLPTEPAVVLMGAIPTTWTVATPSGGFHFYFRAPDRTIKNATGGGPALGGAVPKVDIRGAGGYVVAAGSKLGPVDVDGRAQSTGEYRWIVDPTEMDIADWPEGMDTGLNGWNVAPPAPPKPRAKAATRTPRKPRSNVPGVTGRQSRWLKAQLADLSSAPEGSRNDTLNRISYEVGLAHGEGGLRGDVEGALRGACVAWGVEEPGRKTTETLQRAFRKGVDDGVNRQAVETEPPEDDGGRPVINLVSGALAAAAAGSVAAITTAAPAEVVTYGGYLTGVLATDGSVETYRHDAHSIMSRLAVRVSYQRYDRKLEDWAASDPPKLLAQVILSDRSLWGFRPLEAVFNRPVICRDGRVIQDDVFDEETGYYVRQDGVFPKVPETPSMDDAQAAAEVLLAPFGEFEFEDDAIDRSSVLCAILTALGSNLVRSRGVPAWAISAPIMESGKSLMVDCVSLIAAGKVAAKMPWSTDEEEQRKRITAVLGTPSAMICIDNVDKLFKSSALSQAITESVWQDRVLGKSEQTAISTRNRMWAINGNNLEFADDIKTRVMLTRLHPAVERPGARQFAIRDLVGHIRDNRAALVVAGLTVLKAFSLAGKPLPEVGAQRRQQEWSDQIRAAVIWLGHPDPQDFARSDDLSGDGFEEMAEAMLLSIETLGGELGLGVDKLYDLYKMDEGGATAEHGQVGRDLRNQLLNFCGDRVRSARTLGVKLGAIRDRIIGGMVLTRVQVRTEGSRVRLWVVKRERPLVGDTSAVDSGHTDEVESDLF